MCGYHIYPSLPIKALVVFLLNIDDPFGPCIQGLTTRSQTGVYSLFDWMFDVSDTQWLTSLVKGSILAGGIPCAMSTFTFIG